MKALVTGATGMVGRALLARLERPVVLTRAVDEAKRQFGHDVTAWAWQPATELAPALAFEGLDAVFHLAGEPVAEGRWTAAKKRRIKDSRVLGTRNLVAALTALPTPPRVLVCASGVNFYGYGERGDAELREGSPRGEGFLAEVCDAWESEARAAERVGIRVVMARLGIVLGPRGGALARMLPPFRLGVGGKLADGLQWMSWVHLDDVLGLLLHAAHDQRVRGPMNVVSPEPVTNVDFTRELAQALGRPAVLTVPGLALKVALGELSQALLGSLRVLPGVAVETGYTFVYPRLGPALAACLRG
jgi:uncharacterized protein (TIGR01777 family)